MNPECTKTPRQISAYSASAILKAPGRSGLQMLNLVQIASSPNKGHSRRAFQAYAHGLAEASNCHTRGTFWGTERYTTPGYIAMGDLLKQITGLDTPEGVPTLLAISIAVSGATEEEARQMIDHGEPEAIRALREAGFFGERVPAPVEAGPSSNQDRSTLTSNCCDDQDGGALLWKMLKAELQADETDFKHRIIVLDEAVKGNRLPDIYELSRNKAKDFIPVSRIIGSCPWNGCKFASSAVLYFVAKTDRGSKREAVAPISHSLGGCSIPPSETLKRTRWPYDLMQAYTEAMLAAETQSTCTALHCMLL